MSFSDDLQPIHDEYLARHDELEQLHSDLKDAEDEHFENARFDNDCRALQRRNALGGKKYARWSSVEFKNQLSISNANRSRILDRIGQKKTEVSLVKDKIIGTIYEHLVRDAAVGEVKQGTILDINEAFATYNLSEQKLLSETRLQNWVEYPLDDAIYFRSDRGWPLTDSGAESLTDAERQTEALKALAVVGETLGNAGTFMAFTHGLVGMGDLIRPIGEVAAKGVSEGDCYAALGVIMDRVRAAAGTIQATD